MNICVQMGFGFFITLFLVNHVWASPNFLNLQSRIAKPNNAGYLEATSVQFRLTVTDPVGTCVLFQEDFSNVDMTNSKGLINIKVGTGTKAYPAGALPMTELFNNFGAPVFNCQTSGTYTAALTDSRKLVMQFNDGSGWQTVPSMEINSVPFALSSVTSQKLGQYGASDYTRRAEFTSCTASEAVHFNGTNFTCVPIGGGSASSLTGATAINTIDNTNFAQNWNWSTATTQNPMTFSANALTTGSLLNLTTSNNALNSTNGLLNVANNGTSTNGLVARIQSNSTVGSGLAVLANGNVGIGTTTPSMTLSLGNGTGIDGALLAKGYGTVGTDGLTLVESGAGARMIWYPKKAAFRAGSVSGTQWDDVNIGLNSVAGGEDVVASGARSSSFGFGNQATGDASTALGYSSTAVGAYSIAAGQSVTADSFSQTSIGKHNLPTGSENSSSWVTTDPLFVVGNGTGPGASRSNAMMILKNGNVGLGTNPGVSKLKTSGVFGSGFSSGIDFFSDVTSIGSSSNHTGLNLGVELNGSSTQAGSRLTGIYNGVSSYPDINVTGITGLTSEVGYYGSGVAATTIVGHDIVISEFGYGSNVTNMYGQRIYSDNSGAVVTNNTGLYARAYNYSGYTSTKMVGVEAESDLRAFSGATNLIGIMTRANIYGTATNRYGLYIDTQAGTPSSGNDFALYSLATQKSYFAGSLGVGTTSPGAKLDVTDASTTTSAIIVPRAGNFTGANVNGMIRYNTTSTLFEFRQNGSWVNFTPVSDGRLKTDVVPVTDGLGIVSRLNPVFYNWDYNNPKASSFERKHQVGFIAQEVEQVLPEVVLKGEDSYRSLEYGKIVSVVVAAVKELYSKVLGVDKELALLKVENLELKNKVQKTEQENAMIKVYLCSKDPAASICN